MRKWFYAGAVAGGFLLLGAAPAQADVVPAPAGASTAGGGLDSLLPADLLGGGLPGGGLTPDGQTGVAGTRRESALFDGGVPLLGGLGGLRPANGSPSTLPATGDDAPAGLPAGGTAVDPVFVDPPPSTAVTPPPSTVDPSPSGSARPSGEPSGQTVDDPRLHEEPITDEAGGRTFSPGGRPIAGEDEDFR